MLSFASSKNGLSSSWFSSIVAFITALGTELIIKEIIAERLFILVLSNFKSSIDFIDFTFSATNLSKPLKQFFTLANGLVLPS